MNSSGQISTKMKQLWIAFYLLLYLNSLNGKGPVHENILKWWTEQSVLKPINCEVNSEYKKPFHTVAKEFLNHLKIQPLIVSRPCLKTDEKLISYTFSGKINNGYLEGLGKLKIKDFMLYPEGKLQEKKENCLIVNELIHGKTIIQ